MTVFYFTGTGNSLYAARKIADSSNTALISIPQVIDEQRNYTDDTIGFIYPQYAAGLPKMVRHFILSNTFKADYFFAVDLYAFLRAGALGEIAALIPLDYGAYLKTPFNFTFLVNAPKNPSIILAKADRTLDKISNDIASRRQKHIRPKSGEGNATKYFSKSHFMVTSDCLKCGTCAYVCPAKNITLKDSVVFEHNCENCFACVNLCPAHAIYAIKSMLKRRQYRNPSVSIDEIAKANTITIRNE